jgi:hypothetical protein
VDRIVTKIFPLSGRYDLPHSLVANFLCISDAWAFISITAPCLRKWSNTKIGPLLKFEIFTAVKIQIEVFWVVMTCSFVVGHQRFRGQCFTVRWKQQDPPKRRCPTIILHGVTTQKTSTWIWATLFSLGTVRRKYLLDYIFLAWFSSIVFKLWPQFSDPRSAGEPHYFVPEHRPWNNYFCHSQFFR